MTPVTRKNTFGYSQPPTNTETGHDNQVDDGRDVSRKINIGSYTYVPHSGPRFVSQ